MNKKGKIAIIVASSVALLAGGGTALYFFVFKNKVEVVTEIKLKECTWLTGEKFLNNQTAIKKGNKYKIVADDLSIALKKGETIKPFNDAILIFTTSSNEQGTSLPNKDHALNISDICDTKCFEYFYTSAGTSLGYRMSDDDPEQNVMNWDSTKFYAKFGKNTFSDTMKGFTWEFTAASTTKVTFKVGLPNYSI